MHELSREAANVLPALTAATASSDTPDAGTWFGKREDFEYDIFISYRWKDGRHAAKLLSRKLRAYRPPRGFPRSIKPIRVYRDVELERVTPNIWEERVKPALRRSRFLLVVWTPGVLETGDPGKPNWVMREIREFLTLSQGDNVLIVRALGPDEIPMLPDIAERFPEPGWVDLRPAKSISDFFKRQLSRSDKLTALAVPAIEIKETEIPLFNRLADRERRRAAWWVAAVSMFLLAVISALAVTALVQRNTAIREAAQWKVSEFAARARADAQIRPDLAIALAIQSLNGLTAYGEIPAEGEQALRGALAEARGEHRFCLRAPNSYSETLSADLSSDDDGLLAIGTSAGDLCICAKDPERGFELVEGLQSFGGWDITQARFTSGRDWLVTYNGWLRALNLAKTVLDPSKRKFAENNYGFDQFGDADQTGVPAFDLSASRVVFYRSDTRKIEMWDLVQFNPEGKPTRSFAVDEDVVATGISPNGRYVAALVSKPDLRSPPDASGDHYGARYVFSVLLWSTDTGTVRKLGDVLEKIEWLNDDFGRKKPTGVLRVTDDAKWLAVGIQLEDTHNPRTQLAAEIWSLQRPQPVRLQQFTGQCKDRYGCSGETPEGWTRIGDLDFTPDGKFLYIVHNTSIRVWALDTIGPQSPAVASLMSPSAPRRYTKSLGVISNVSASSDGRYLVYRLLNS
jgi:hypothetical protein